MKKWLCAERCASSRQSLSSLTYFLFHLDISFMILFTKKYYYLTFAFK